MKFYDRGVFHIYNQGNDKKPIFFYRENYEFFLWKIKKHILPFADIISWCLMPNHFHLLVVIKDVIISKQDYLKHFDQIENERRVAQYGDKAILLNRPNDYYDSYEGLISLNQAIGTMLGSYSQAINKRYGSSGSIFRKRCKSKDGMLAFLEDEKFEQYQYREDDYISTCSHYIHDNPRKAGLCLNVGDYEWSSARDYLGKSNEKSFLTNIEIGRKMIKSLESGVTA